MVTTEDIPRLLRKPEAAHRLAVSISSLDELMRQGRVPYLKIGRLVRFDSRALDEWITQQNKCRAA